jgi:hypothetical protein
LQKSFSRIIKNNKSSDNIINVKVRFEKKIEINSNSKIAILTIFKIILFFSLFNRMFILFKLNIFPENTL